jgi:L-lysine 2,3-aminomutase
VTLAAETVRLKIASRRRRRDWTDELRHAATTVAELAQRLDLTEEERLGAERAERAGLPISITPYYLSLADRRDPSCPIRRQCVPHLDESREVAGDLVDPLGEKAHEVAPDLVCRYPDRALLLCRIGARCTADSARARAWSARAAARDRSSIWRRRSHGFAIIPKCATSS